MYRQDTLGNVERCTETQGVSRPMLHAVNTSVCGPAQPCPVTQRQTDRQLSPTCACQKSPFSRNTLGPRGPAPAQPEQGEKGRLS